MLAIRCRRQGRAEKGQLFAISHNCQHSVPTREATWQPLGSHEAGGRGEGPASEATGRARQCHVAVIVPIRDLRRPSSGPLSREPCRVKRVPVNALSTWPTSQGCCESRLGKGGCVLHPELPGVRRGEEGKRVRPGQRSLSRVGLSLSQKQAGLPCQPPPTERCVIHAHTHA